MSPPFGLGDTSPSSPQPLPHSTPSICFYTCLAILLGTLSVRKLCPLCNLQTIQGIFPKLHIDVNQHKTTCRAQEPLVLHLYFLEIFPLELCLLQNDVHSVGLIRGGGICVFIEKQILVLIFQGDSLSPCSIPSRISKVAFYSIAVLILMLLFNIAAKVSALLS